jgi:hypothetical protein
MVAKSPARCAVVRAFWPLALTLLACTPAPEPERANVCPSNPLGDAGVGDAQVSPESPGPAGYFKIEGEHFTVWDGDRYRPLFVRAMNIGASLPGSGPNDLDMTYDDYRCWLDILGSLGFNALRLYVPHYPAFYSALADHNHARPDQPLYILQGSYLPEPPEESEDVDIYQFAGTFDGMLRDLVDVVHGHGNIARGPRGAFGTYPVDVSRWTLGYIVGREVLATEALSTNAAHPSATRYEGKRLRMLDVTATEAFMAERLDKLVDYERTQYNTGRPIAWSNWLELDPITHPTEGSSSKKDIAQADFAKLDPFDVPAGHFVSYHVYPYYPNFVSEDPDYRMFSDEMGPNSYLGMLHALREHHAGQALFIAEFGVPSSWGRAHTSHSGMHHGGLNEDQQARFAGRMTHNIHSAGAAGFAYFQLTDGWWKRVWVTAPITFPHERLRYWHDMMNAQQNYGIIAFDLPPPDWDKGQVDTGSGRVRALRVRYDAEFVHLRVELDAPLEPGEELVLGLDTYADDRGELQLPNGKRTQRSNEFALVVDGAGTAELLVMRSYDLKSIRNAVPARGAAFRSTKSTAGDWVQLVWPIAAAHGSDDGKYNFATEELTVGKLRVHDPEAPSSLDAVFIEGQLIEARLPWTLLNFAEPPRRVVIDDDVSTPERETAVTPGIAYSASLGDTLLETGRHGWSRWGRAPATTARLKPVALALARALSELPYWLDAGDTRVDARADADAGND